LFDGHSVKYQVFWEIQPSVTSRGECTNFKFIKESESVSEDFVKSVMKNTLVTPINITTNCYTALYPVFFTGASCPRPVPV